MKRFLLVIPAMLTGPARSPAADPVPDPLPAIHIAVVNGLTLHGPWPALAHGYAGQAKIETLPLRRDEAVEALQDGVADAALVHGSSDLKSLEESGLIEPPIPWAYSGYLLVGPAGDPATARSATTAAEALKRILAAKSPVLLPSGRGAAAKWEELIASTGQAPPTGLPTAHLEKNPLEQAAALRAYSLIPRQSDLMEAAAGLKMACFLSDDPALRHAFVMLIRKGSAQAVRAKSLSVYLTSAAAAPLFPRPAGSTGRWLEIFPWKDQPPVMKTGKSTP